MLSSILLAPKEVIGLAVESGVTKESFYMPAHGEIFETLLELWNANRPIDFITIAQYLRDRNRLDQIGGPAALNDLFVFLPTAANAGYYIEILLEKFTLREIIKVCNEYSARSYEEQDNTQGLLDEVEDEDFPDREGSLQGQDGEPEGNGHEGHRRHQQAVRKPRKDQRAVHGFQKAGPAHGRAARRGDVRHRGAALDGQDRLRDEHGRACRGGTRQGRRGVLAGNEFAAARAAFPVLHRARESRLDPQRLPERPRLPRAHRWCGKTRVGEDPD